MKDHFATFVIPHDVGVELMERLKPTIPKKGIGWMFTHVEIIINDKHIVVKRPGLELTIGAQTEGLGVVTFPIIYLRDELSTIRDVHLFKVVKDFIHVGNVKIGAETKFTSADLYKSISDLPMNYDFVDILRMKYTNITHDDIWFKNFDKLLIEAEKEKDLAINQAYRGLQPFGYTRQMVIELIDNALHKNHTN